MIVPGNQIRPDSKLGVVNVLLVMSNAPFVGLLDTNRIGPTEPHDTRTDSDPKSSGFQLDPATGGTRCPRRCGFEQCRGRGNHLGAREPQPQCVDRA